MIRKETFAGKVYAHLEDFVLDYDLLESQNVFRGVIGDMTISIYEYGRATVKYHGILRRADGNHTELYQDILRSKQEHMQDLFGQLETIERHPDD